MGAGAAGKKLRAAAGALIAGGGGRDESLDDAAAFGLSLPPAPASEAVWVLPQNWPAVRAFVACATQWRYGPSGHPTGLDYAGCRAAVAALGIKWRKVFEGLRVMEAEAMRVIGERGK